MIPKILNAGSESGRALLVVVIVTLPGVAGCMKSDAAAPAQSGESAAQQAPPTDGRPLPVKTVRPMREHLLRTTTQPAHVAPYEQTDVVAKASGYLKSFGQVTRDDGQKPRDLDIGDRVTEGQVLAELWIPEMDQERLRQEALLEQARAEQSQAEAAVRSAESMVESSRASLEEVRAHIVKWEAEVSFRKSEYDRTVALVNARAVQQALADERLNQWRAAEASLAEARAALASAEANINVQNAKLAQARADLAGATARVKVAAVSLDQTAVLLGYARIRAPFDGVITRRLVDTGAFVQSASTGRIQPLFTIARNDRLRIVADIPEADTSFVRIGQAAVLRVDANRGQEFRGRVVRITDALDPNTRTMRTEIELDEPMQGLRAGMFGSVTLTLADLPDSVTLPASALLIADDKPGVFVVEGGRAVRREIAIGYNDGIRVHVLEGLAGNEDVVTDGKNALRDGQPVETSP